MLKILIPCPGSDGITDKETSPSKKVQNPGEFFFLNFKLFNLYWGIANYFPGASEGKAFAYNTEDLGSISG